MNDEKGYALTKVQPLFEDLAKERLKLGKFDITFAMGILNIIIQKCESMAMQPQQLSFTLKESCKRLYSMLEVEKNHMELLKKKYDQEN